MKISGEFQEGARIAWESIRANKMRSALTTVGIVIGIVTVSLMATALEELDRAFREAVSFLGTDMLYVSQRAWFIDSDYEWEAVQKRSKITLAQARALERELDRVRGVTPTANSNMMELRYKDRTANLPTVTGTTDAYLTTGGHILAAGRFLTRAEVDGNRDVCVIGHEVAAKLFPDESPLGAELRVGERDLTIVGVFARRGSVLGQMSLDNEVIVPITKLLGGYRWEPSVVIQVKVGDPARLDATREELRGLMRKIRRVPPGKPDDFAINQQEQLAGQFGKVSAIIATCGFFITGLSLFVGGIGIMNIMFVSVAERTREIGVRKAIGARRRTILLQFLLEAVGICILGGVLGLGFTAIGIAIARQWLPAVTLSLTVVALALGVASLTGIIAGFLPAWRAARLSPVEALRQE